MKGDLSGLAILVAIKKAYKNEVEQYKLGEKDFPTAFSGALLGCVW